MKKFALLLLMLSICIGCFAQFDGGMPPAGAPSMQPPKGGMRPDKPMKKAVKKEKKKKVQDEDVFGKVDGKVYIFGCSSEFGDSVIYITEIQEVDSTALMKKTKFLPYRSDYSQQLKDKLESKTFSLKNQTCSVFFSDKKAKLEKKYAKIKKRYLTKFQMKVVPLSQSEFKFVHPLDYYSVSE